MQRLIEEVRAALNAGAFTLALQGTLALVDICAALSADDGRTRRTRFKEWFTANLGHVYPAFDADDVYQLRCGMLHQGRISSDQYKAVIFTLPNTARIVMHNNIFDDAYNLDLLRFCNDVIGAAEKWWESNKELEPARSNSESLVRIRPDGLPPHIKGIPVLA